MTQRIIASLGIAAVAAAAIAFSGSAQPPAETPPKVNVANDRDAIEKAAKEFATAFNKGDAKAIAAMFTENAEAREGSGKTYVGQAAIEKSYADFFKANADAKIEVLVKSVRFPAHDLAVEEGLIRQSRGTKVMPGSTSYVAVHVREGGTWKIALSSEANAGQDRLEDLEWLLGEWSTKVKDTDVKFVFAKDAKKPVITGTFTRTTGTKAPVSGSIRIAFDPETGHIRSWGFEDDGAHSQSLWSNDGKSWLLESRGVLANGTLFSETIVLQRVAPDAIVWRSIDRMLGGEQLPDTPPLKLTKTK